MWGEQYGFGSAVGYASVCVCTCLCMCAPPLRDAARADCRKISKTKFCYLNVGSHCSRTHNIMHVCIYIMGLPTSYVEGGKEIHGILQPAK